MLLTDSSGSYVSLNPHQDPAQVAVKETSVHRTILDSVPIGIFTVDTDWRITFFNREAEKITGFTRTQALKCRCYEIFRTSLCHTGCYLREALETGKNIIKVRNTILTKSNAEVPVSITAAVLRDHTGKVWGGVESFLDDTGRVALEKRIEESYVLGDIIGKDEKMVKLFDILPVVAESGASVLILGETGTGKDLLARAIHNMSLHREGPFIKVNCAALPDNLLESELFGYKKGAFTDAKRDKPGRFQLAEGGTIFLDEIGDLSQNLQAKLLQVLDEKEFYPLGSGHPVKVDVRVVASTNKNLSGMVRNGTFREDLYFRLKVIELRLPPLRERLSDIPLLIDHFVSEIGYSLGKEMCGIGPDAMNILLNYPYPGNVRELKNIVEHALTLCQGDMILKNALPGSLLGPETKGVLSFVPPLDSPGVSTDPLLAKEKAAILEALATHGWNRQMTAKALHINRTTLWRKMKKHGLASGERR
jgi:PAS domain S-box-containing protein